MNTNIGELISDGQCLACHGTSLTDMIKIGLLDRIATECGAAPVPEVRTPMQFNPNVHLWVHPTSFSAPYVDGNNIATWDDASGFGNHMLGPVGNQPIYRANLHNGFAGAEFVYSGVPATSDYLRSTNADIVALFNGVDSPFTCSIVVRRKAFGLYAILFSNSQAAINRWIECGCDNAVATLVTKIVNDGTAQFNTTLSSYGQAPLIHAYSVITFVYNGTANTMYSWTDERAQHAINPYINTDKAFTGTGLNIGIRYNPLGIPLDGYVLEAVVWNVALSGVTVLDLHENYFNWKYGLGF